MKSALGEALKLLAKRERFEAELRELLHGRGFGPEDIGAAIGQLQAWGVLSDSRAECVVVESHLLRQGHGRLKLAAKFVSHGIDQDDAMELARLHIPDDLERQRAEAYLVTTFGSKVIADSAFRKLIGRGFDPEIAQSVVEAATDHV